MLYTTDTDAKLLFMLDFAVESWALKYVGFYLFI